MRGIMLCPWAKPSIWLDLSNSAGLHTGGRWLQGYAAQRSLPSKSNRIQSTAQNFVLLRPGTDWHAFRYSVISS